MKIIEEKSYSQIEKHLRNVNAHNKQMGKHGKPFEKYLEDYFKFPVHDQHKDAVDFRKEIVEQGNVPESLIGDWEVKYYDIKRKDIMLGDVERKLLAIKKDLILVVGFYDRTPDKLVDVKFYKLSVNPEIEKMEKIWLETASFVKDYSNTLEETKEEVKSINRLNRGSAFRLANNSLPDRWSPSKCKMEKEKRQINLCINLRKLEPIA
jgi:hypothetical protein